MSLRLLIAVLTAALTSCSLAQDVDDESLPAGLVAKYTAGDLHVTRIDPDVQFTWGRFSPDPRLPEHSFKAQWTGTLFVRGSEKHRFHAFVRGRMEVLIDGKTLLKAEQSGSPAWHDGKEFDLEFGEHQLAVLYDRQSEPEAVARLFWSAESFPLEPVPPQALFHDKSAIESPDAEHARTAALYLRLRCQRCHAQETRPAAPPGPSLVGAARHLRREWVVDRLQQLNLERAKSNLRRGQIMPDYGFTAAEANALADYVLRPAAVQEPAPRKEGEPAPTSDLRGNRQSGRVLFQTVGCVACHSHLFVKVAGDSAGGDLTRIGRKRTPGWIVQWLTDPASVQPNHTMPTFRLTGQERADLAAFLIEERTVDPDASRSTDRVEEGRKLFRAARCAACHESGELMPLPSVPIKVHRPGNHQSCALVPPDRHRGRPHYPQVDQQELVGLSFFLNHINYKFSPESPFDRGARLLKESNCIGCHDRDGQKGLSAVAAEMAALDDSLRGQSEALIPPDLSAIGDKLHDAALAPAIAGEQPGARLPWLRVRMPKFKHTPEDREAILAYLVGHDRIPERPDEKPPELPKPDLQAKAEPPPGAKLLGTKGFNCSACHKIGPLEPRNVALGTRGSDLFRIGERMRFPFFVRWTRSPLRIVPGMEMPSYEKPIKGILKDHLDLQLAAMWQSLNETQPPAVDGSSVEQVISVPPGQPAKIIRDVFRLGDLEPFVYVARPIAVGFGNGQNLLFDLDAASLRLWWAGDFARQRTLGKTWFWETGAATLVPPKPLVPDIALRAVDGRIVLPERDGVVGGRLVDYSQDGPGARLRYRLQFRAGDTNHAVLVGERWLPDPQGPNWRRELLVQNVPPAFAPVFLKSSEATNPTLIGPEPPAGHAWTQVSVTAVDRDAKGAEKPVTLQLDFVTLPPAGKSGEFSLGFLYGTHSPGNRAAPTAAAVPGLRPEPVTVVPGYDGVRLPLDRSIMPTAIAWRGDGTLAFCSLKGQVFLAKDTDGDGIEDRLSVFEEGLAAPYGLIADGNDLIVAHKPELLRLKDTDGDGRADLREVLASGWGYSDNYHDWTCGIVRDSRGNLYVGLGSDYAQPERDRATSRWRGAVLRIDPRGQVTPMGFGFRYPTGLAITPDDDVFVSDNQGVQNTFNEINHLVEGGRYGVPALADDPKAGPVLVPAIQVPHPWTRSVNGLFFLPRETGHPFAGQGLGCEYDSRFLIRFSLQRVGETWQGATYPFAKPPPQEESQGFLGTLCGGVSPGGEITIGSIHDSGWLGGPNVGDIVRLTARGDLPIGIREATAWRQGFVLDFTEPLDRDAAAKSENYVVSAYTRKWLGAYATPDSGRHTVSVDAVEVSGDGRRVKLTLDTLQPGFVYEISVRKVSAQPLWPDTAHYTVNRVPD